MVNSQAQLPKLGTSFQQYGIRGLVSGMLPHSIGFLECCRTILAHGVSLAPGGLHWVSIFCLAGAVPSQPQWFRQQFYAVVLRVRTLPVGRCALVRGVASWDQLILWRRIQRQSRILYYTMLHYNIL